MHRAITLVRNKILEALSMSCYPTIPAISHQDCSGRFSVQLSRAQFLCIITLVNFAVEKLTSFIRKNSFYELSTVSFHYVPLKIKDILDATTSLALCLININIHQWVQYHGVHVRQKMRCHVSRISIHYNEDCCKLGANVSQ